MKTRNEKERNTKHGIESTFDNVTMVKVTSSGNNKDAFCKTKN